MSLSCKLGMHAWDGCKCTKCGDKIHSWGIIPPDTISLNGHLFNSNGICLNCGIDIIIYKQFPRCKKIDCICTKCGKENHNWDGCKCSNCGKTRNEGHTWDGCKCKKCSETKDENHSWTKDEYHKLNDYKCTKCGSLINDIMIGNQVWMTKNLDVEHYRNGDRIPQLQDKEEWSHIQTGAWCYYKNNIVFGKYGKLYNWYAVNDPRGLAPEGWHIPTYKELAVLKKAVLEDGNSLKEIGQGEENGTGTNTSGFSAFMSGYRDDLNVYFYNIKKWLFFGVLQSIMLISRPL